MIFDTCAHAASYFERQSPLYKAVQFAAQFTPSLPDGRYAIDGDAIYAVVATYTTKPASEGKFEAHRKYIDVQMLLEGCEFIDVSLNQHLEITEAYSEEKDITFYTAPLHATSVLLEPGQFAVFYPHDIHRPCRQTKEPCKVRKMVVKVSREVLKQRTA